MRAESLLREPIAERIVSGRPRFAAVVIDEAGLIPRAVMAALALHARESVLLAGDPKQLAPISRIARVLPPDRARWLAQSGLSHLRIEAPPPETVVLHRQYRMHAAIRKVVSESTEAKEGRFRSDLYFRLGVFPIAVPPLRERKEDLEELASTFLEQAARRLGSAHLTALPATELARLQAYDWPGNVRELQHVVERAAILAGSGPARFGGLLDDDPGLGTAMVDAVQEGASADQGPEALPSLDDLKALERALKA